VSTHTKHIHLYVGCFIFSRKRRAHADIIPEGFFALSAPRRCMRSAAVVERHTPPRTIHNDILSRPGPGLSLI